MSNRHVGGPLRPVLTALLAAPLLAAPAAAQIRPVQSGGGSVCETLFQQCVRQCGPGAPGQCTQACFTERARCTMNPSQPTPPPRGFGQ